MSNTRVQDPIIFHRSAPMNCPYLNGEVEQQLFTELVGGGAQRTFETLSTAGFRRSHHIIYRPACSGCNACQPVRIDCKNFVNAKQWRRIANANRDLTVVDAGMKVSQPQYDLFRRYVQSRHGDGDMADMTARDYVSLVTASPVDTRLYEFRNEKGSLVAGCLSDHTHDGLSAVYSYFDPDQPKRSLGSFMILWMIEEALRLRKNYVYLGFYISQSKKMTYKARFKPLEVFGPSGWKHFDPPVTSV